ncbi:sulfotransferase family protein [Herbidospora yilanensis]|uniref:sulfotransferase family protein n=1 Tax=Herbidospora yilanensis TaxID=354426 RepID=UPI0007813AA4|nr:sulfotransferase [Herbidospora yilanensis]
MKWKQVVNTTLEGVTGYTIQRQKLPTRPAPPPKPMGPPMPPRLEDDVARPPADLESDRLLRAPVFILSPPRSGSTLLRSMMNSHSQLHSPIETHFRRISTNLNTDPVRQAVVALGHNQSDVEHLLWDRLLHRELVRSGKPTLVEKTPSNVFAWKRLSICWPDARFVFLLRHPLSIARSWHEADPVKRPMHEAVRHTFQYMKYLEEARHRLPGHEITYENLTADPENELRALCATLRIPFEEGMLDYGRHNKPTDFTKGIGDWRDKIQSGRVQPGRELPAPEEVPEMLRDVAQKWGYL